MVDDPPGGSPRRRLKAEDPRLDLSVVVPTRGRAPSVERLLQSLARQIDPPSFEVIVSIDGPEDGTSQIVGRLVERLPVMTISQAHRGRGAACNAGARHAQGRVLVLLDDDMEAAPSFLREHARAHGDDGPRAIVGPVPIRDDEAAPPIVRYRAKGFARKLERLRCSEGEPALREMYTGNFSVPRRLFLEVGGFDESFVAYGNEDFELLVRLRRAGARLGFAPGALARQHYEKTYSDLARDTAGEGHNAVLFAERHPALLDELYLMEFGRFPASRRLALAIGSTLARAWPGSLAAVAALIARAERRGAPRLFRYYDLAFDLHYWLGVQRALRDRPGRERQSWSEWVSSLRHAQTDREPGSDATTRTG